MVRTRAIVYSTIIHRFVIREPNRNRLLLFDNRKIDSDYWLLWHGSEFKWKKIRAFFFFSKHSYELNLEAENLKSMKMIGFNLFAMLNCVCVHRKLSANRNSSSTIISIKEICDCSLMKFSYFVKTVDKIRKLNIHIDEVSLRLPPSVSQASMLDCC